MHHKILKVPLCLDVFLNMIHQSKKINSSISLQRSNLSFRYEGKIKLKTELKLKQKILKIEVRKKYCPKLFIQSLFLYNGFLNQN
jgi:hypothetical protein